MWHNFCEDEQFLRAEVRDMSSDLCFQMAAKVREWGCKSLAALPPQEREAERRNVEEVVTTLADWGTALLT